MKKLLFTLLFLTLGAAWGEPEDYTLKIELATCTPDGMIIAWKERHDPRKFWFSQNVLFKIEVENDSDGLQLKSKLDSCETRHNLQKKFECINFYTSQRDAIIRCYLATKNMCIAYGGLRC